MRHKFDLELEGFEAFSKAIDPVLFKKRLSEEIRAANMRLSVLGVDVLRRAIHSAQSWAKPNSPVTIALKGSSKPLFDHGDLWGNTSSKLLDAFQFVVGTNRVDDSGKVNVAAVLHNGATIKVTPKMRAYFRYLHVKTDGKVMPLSKDTRTIVIPARPYMKRAFLDDPSFVTLCMNQWAKASIRAMTVKGKGKRWN